MNFFLLFSLIRLIGHCLSCSNSFFIRWNDLTNSKLNLYAELRNFPEKTGCVQWCYVDPTCLAFTYNPSDGTCYLHQIIPVEPEGTNPEPGVVTFWKLSDAPVCDIPTSVPNGQVLYADGQGAGSMAWFVCDDFYVPDTENGVCGSNGQWQGLQAACVQKSTPFSIPVESKIFPGACIQLIGTPTPSTASTFAVILLYENGDEHIVMDSRFNIPDFQGGVIARNDKVNGVYGEGQLNTPVWPFAENTEFNMTICTELAKYRVYVDGQEIFTFDYRSPLEGITSLAVHQGVTIRRVRFTG